MAGVATSLPPSACKKTPVTPDENYSEAIVIGSGFGGSVASLRLGQAGIKTLLFEMGKQYTVNPAKNVFTETLNPDGRSTWLKKRTIAPVVSIQFDIPKYVGVLDRVEFQPLMRIYRGACLGGELCCVWRHAAICTAFFVERVLSLCCLQRNDNQMVSESEEYS